MLPSKVRASNQEQQIDCLLPLKQKSKGKCDSQLYSLFCNLIILTLVNMILNRSNLRSQHLYHLKNQELILVYRSFENLGVIFRIAKIVSESKNYHICSVPTAGSIVDIFIFLLKLSAASRFFTLSPCVILINSPSHTS